MAEFIATSNSFFKLGMAMIKKHKPLETYKENTEQERVFKQNFGVSALVLTQCWKLLIKHSDERLIQPPKPQQKKLAPKHLLWACFFLKTYNKESVNSSMAETSEKTFRHWAWTVIRLISDLEPYVVSEND
jgi:hypothetical protein